MKTMRAWMPIAAIAATIAIAAGCSQSPTAPDAPPAAITVTLRTGESLAPAPSAVAPAVDSMVVRVFHPHGAAPEVVRGATVTSGTVTMRVSCAAENNKRVSVELYTAGAMTHHGWTGGVDVSAGKTTPVNITAERFSMGTLSVSPGIVTAGTPVTVSWPRVPGASFYRVQDSPSPDFASVAWQGVVSDTFVVLTPNAGAHYVRVAPATVLATGDWSDPDLAYGLSGSGGTRITGLDTPGAPPGGVAVIRGEQLDFPGVQAFVGSLPCQTVSAAWDRLEFLVPPGATTDVVSVFSPLDGGDTWTAAPLVVERIALVTATREYADAWVQALTYYPSQIGYSGVAVVDVTELDTRDLSLFDVIVVANDTGTSADNWGGGVPARADAIASAGRPVLALGLGGAVYLQALSGVAPSYTPAWSVGQIAWTPDPTAPIYTTPNRVLTAGENTFLVSTLPAALVTLDSGGMAAPAGTTWHAATAAGSSQWLLIDFGSGSGARTMFFGFAGDPSVLTGQGADLVSNLIAALVASAGSPPVP